MISFHAAGGMYLVTLNRSTLVWQSDQLYVTNCHCTDRTQDNGAVSVAVRILGRTSFPGGPGQPDFCCGPAVRVRCYQMAGLPRILLWLE